MKTYSALSIAAGCLLPVSVASAAAFYNRFDNNVYSEPLTVDTLLGDWEVPVDSGERILSSHWFEVGAEWSGWTVAWFDRAYRHVYTNDDTVNFVHDTRNGVPLEAGKLYDIKLDGFHVHTQGARIGRLFEPGPAFRVKTFLVLMDGQALREGVLSGVGFQTGQEEFGYDFAVDYVYTDDFLFGRKNPQPDGEGFGMDIEAVYEAGPWSFALEAINLGAFVEWRQVPRTTAAATSDNQGYDEQGYVRYDAHVSGKEDYRTVYRQRIPPSGRFDMTYQPGPSRWLMSIRHYEAKTLIAAGYGREWFGGYWTARYDFVAETIGASLGAKHWQFAVEMDDYRLRRMKSYALSWRLHWRF